MWLFGNKNKWIRNYIWEMNGFDFRLAFDIKLRNQIYIWLRFSDNGNDLNYRL